MKHFTRLLLEVWREVCRHLEIGDSLERVAPPMAGRMSVKLVLIRHLDVQRSLVETVASWCWRPRQPLPPPQNICRPDDMKHLLMWCKQEQILRAEATVAHEQLPGLVPAGLRGEILAGPLNTVEGPGGLLLLEGRDGHPFKPEHEELLRALLEPFTVALENDRRLRELTSLREAVEADNRSLLSRLGRHDITDSVVGAETGLRAVMEQIELVAPSDAPVLVLGETGTGKEVVARAIHQRSRRVSGPFLRVNCGAIPPELVDSELFGHERGSFTGAVGERKGWFERTDGGTLFLDECGELPLAAQVRLLRILQDGSFERVGGERSLHVDVRIVAATHRDLQALVSEGRFRADLWYRIAVFPIHLPPLRARSGDIPSLAAHFALRAAKRLGTPPLVPTAEDIRLLISYPWPGNVRELAAVIERAAILGGGKGLEVAQALGTPPVRSPEPAPANASPGPAIVENEVCTETGWLTLDAAMARHIESALRHTHGRIEGPDGAAKLLAVNPHTLRARMRKLGLDWSRFRRAPTQWVSG
ncbi:MAG TPA: sigma 54-interacting transcriptional regulator [Gemmataceae bacterium]|nr:sigma 54-interacting transcriptional regulator [Gemmataceae bacterium]